MYVIGHYNITPNRHVMIQPSFRVINESTIGTSVSQNFPPTRCAKRDKKEADHKFGVFDLAATVDYDSFHGGVAAAVSAAKSCQCLPPVTAAATTSFY